MDSTQIDLALAENTALRLYRPGPAISRAEIEQAVTELHEIAERCGEVVLQATELPLYGDAKTLVVDRSKWLKANMTSLTKLVELFRAKINRPKKNQVSPQLAGTVVGTMLAYLSSRVLGQFDPFADQPVLLLVVPNIIKMERKLDLDSSDFRHWVMLHEQTHRVQFANAPWIAEKLAEQIGILLEEEAADEGFWSALLDKIKALRAKQKTDENYPVMMMQLAANERASQAFDQITALMSLLEGHADVMMDRAGQEIFSSVWQLRNKFDEHRAKQSFVNKLTGMAAKMQQYTDGADFCRHVIDAAGITTLNQAFASAESAPSLTELRHPGSWLERIGG